MNAITAPGTLTPPSHDSAAIDLAGIGIEIFAQIEALAALSEDGPKLTRIFLSPEHRQANDRMMGWMRAAGMTARVDAIGNVVGRYEGDHPGAPVLLLGSHLDTVRDAGKYDGMLGVVSAIACVAALNRARKRLSFAIEVIGFGDEEGVRFGTTMLGSRAVAGSFTDDLLERTDHTGKTLADGLIAFGLDPQTIGDAARSRNDILAYLELHIEQGPVLETKGAPVGCVTSIAGASRFEVDISGRAGHAGTVPMSARNDALAAAAECIIAIERRCASEPGLVGTVGQLTVAPGAINVIPRHVRFTIDIRAPDDAQRLRAIRDLESEISFIRATRKVGIDIRLIHELKATPCAPWLMKQIGDAITAEGLPRIDLPSGAGHDGMAMIDVADIGMIFVRCAGGVSHSPAESITIDDAEVGARVLMKVIRNFTPGKTP